MKISNRALSIYFVVFAVLYFGYTALVAGHGVHWTNSIIAATAIFLAAYYYLKSDKK